MSVCFILPNKCGNGYTREIYISCLITAELQLLNLSPTAYVNVKGSPLWNNKSVIKTYIGLPSLPYSLH